MMSIKNDWYTAFSREKLLLWRQSSHLINGFCFFLLVGLVYQIMLGPALEMPQAIGAIVLWVLTLLAILLIAEGWLVADMQSGFYDLWRSQGRSLWILFAVKLLCQWGVIAFFLLVFGPLVGLQLGIGAEYFKWMVSALILSSLGMVCICGFGAAIVAGQSSSGLLMAVLVLPLNVPFVVFGAGVIIERLQTYQPWPLLMLLIALSLGTFLLVPPLMSLCVRIILD